MHTWLTSGISQAGMCVSLPHLGISSMRGLSPQQPGLLFQWEA